VTDETPRSRTTAERKAYAKGYADGAKDEAARAPLDVERLRTVIEAELALVTEPVGPFESGAAAAYHHVLAALEEPTDD